MSKRFGIWFIGAWGGVSTTTAVGLAALQLGKTDQTGLMTALPEFESVQLADWDQFLIGGHEIRETSYVAEAKQLLQQSRVFSTEMLEAVSEKLQEFDQHVRKGTLINVGSTISQLATPDVANQSEGEAAWAAMERIGADLTEFRTKQQLEHVIVVNLASTEPPLQQSVEEMDWTQLQKALKQKQTPPVPASSIYAAAAMLAGCSYVNFTPSVGSNIPALKELALEQSVLHTGRDGKTGETLLKSVLAPMFADRNLNVMSWVGHNIFGNMDGRVLDDPVNKATKVHSKDHLLTEILGYPPQSHVSIEYIPSLADWKTAWDHIHFQGFLQTPMIMQFIWQGCDSLLAAPLVLDLVRLIEREQRRGSAGVMKELACFFKSPMDNDEPRFHQQVVQLRDWLQRVEAEQKTATP